MVSLPMVMTRGQGDENRGKRLCMKNTCGMPLVVRPILGEKILKTKQNMRICEVVQLKLIRLRHFVVKGLRFTMAMSRFFLHDDLATKF